MMHCGAPTVKAGGGCLAQERYSCQQQTGRQCIWHNFTFTAYRQLKGSNEKVHTFDTRGHTVPLLRGYGRYRAHCDRDLAWW